MKRKSLKVLIGLVIFVALTINAQERINLNDTQAILITSLKYEGHSKPIPKGDEALILKDKREIAKFVNLFQGNLQIQHACGYHWRITFVSDSGKLTDISFNQNCELFERNNQIIHKFLRSQFFKIKRTPQYFVSQIEVDVQMSAEQAAKAIKEKSRIEVFELDNADAKFPFVEIESKAVSAIPEDRKLWDKATEETKIKAANILLAELKNISANFPILKNSTPRSYSSMFGGNEIEEIYKMKILFPVGTKLDEIQSKLQNVKLIEKQEPKSYFLQIVSRERFSASFANQLRKKIPFIKNSFAYNSTPR